MQDFFQVDDSELSRGRVALRDLMVNHGWKSAKYIVTDESCIFATRPDGKEICIAFGTPPTMSYGAGRIADDKYITYCLLQDLENVKQPETILIKTSDKKARTEARLKEFLKANSEIVIKPFDGAHGLDVFTGIKTMKDALAAIKTITDHAWSGLILVQKMLHSDQPEVRVICVDYQFVGAYARIPAEVTGDGEHSVAELIDLENSTIRTAPYRSNLSYINKAAALAYLNKKSKDLKKYVPEKGEKVQVIGVCNTGQGGTMEDITYKFPDYLKKQSEEIARKLHLPLAGIDYMGESILEVNKAPALYHPVDGPASTICVEKFIEYLENLDI